MNIFGLSFNFVYWDAAGWRLILNSPKSTVHYNGEYYAYDLVERFKIHMQNLSRPAALVFSFYFVEPHHYLDGTVWRVSSINTISFHFIRIVFHADVDTSLMNFTQLPFPWDIQQCFLEGFLDNALEKAHTNQFSIIHILWGYWQLLYQ